MSRPTRRSATTVTSPHNEFVRQARLIERDPARRRRSGLYIAWGLHLAGEALAARAPIARTFASEALERSAEGRDLAGRLAREGSPIVQATGAVLDSIAEGASDQGIVLLLERPRHDLAAIRADGTGLVLAAHGVQDPGNLGSMMRTALAAGAGAFVALEGCADPFASRVVRAGMGAHFRLPIIGGTTVPSLPALRQAGFQIVAADLSAACAPDAFDLTPPSVLCVGSEGQGLPAALVALASGRVRIPMAAGASSLNVHAAAAILLYEAQRQRGFPAARHL